MDDLVVLNVTPDKMLWKLDGKTVYEATEGIPTSPFIYWSMWQLRIKENDYKS